jgi:hypothetical protein
MIDRRVISLSRLRSRTTLTAALVLMATCSTLLMGCHGGRAAPWVKTAVLSILCAQNTQVGVIDLTLNIDPQTNVADLQNNVRLLLAGWVYTVISWDIDHSTTRASVGKILFEVRNANTQEVCGGGLEVIVNRPSTTGAFSGPS